MNNSGEPELFTSRGCRRWRKCSIKDYGV